MLPEFLQDRAALYLAGAMSTAESAEFDLLLECHEELREWLHDLAAVHVSFTAMDQAPPVPGGLRGRIMEAVADQIQPPPDALIRTDARGMIEWVNPAFTRMCGYELAEIQGRRPGSFLQGPDTDPAAVARMRAAQREHRAIEETLWNYHRNGSKYRVQISIQPVLDGDGNLHSFVAREREVPA